MKTVRAATTRFTSKNSLRTTFSFVLGLAIATTIVFYAEIGRFVSRRFSYEKTELKNEEEENRNIKMWRKDSPGERERLEKPPLILLYNHWGRGHDWEGMFAKELNEEFEYQPTCPHKCYFTLDREKYEDKADLVIVATTYPLGTVPDQNK